MQAVPPEGSPDLLIEADRSIVHGHCDGCGRDYVNVTGFVRRDDAPFAVYKAALHHHDRGHEAWIDVLLGSFGSDEPAPDRVTFGCRVGPVPDADSPVAASLVTAAQPYAENELFGAKLTREQALAHPWLREFWAVVDVVLTRDPEVERHVYGPPARA